MKRSEELESETEGEIGVLRQEKKKRDKREKEVNKGGKGKNEAKNKQTRTGCHLDLCLFSILLCAFLRHWQCNKTEKSPPVPDFISRTQRVLII